MLIALEGLDACGKSTQARALVAWLADRGHRAVIERLYGNRHLLAVYDRLNAAAAISARDACLMAAADLAGRLEVLSRPHGSPPPVVVWEKYTLGSAVRDRTRGVPADVVEPAYAGLPRPGLTLYLDVEPTSALARKRRTGRPGLWESGLDVSLGRPVAAIEAMLASGELSDAELDRQFLQFQTAIRARYLEAVTREEALAIDGSRSEQAVAADVRQAVSAILLPGEAR